MKKTSSDSPAYTDRIRSWARAHAHGGPTAPPTLPISQNRQTRQISEKDSGHNNAEAGAPVHNVHSNGNGNNSANKAIPADNTQDGNAAAGQASEPEGTGSVVETKPRPNMPIRFYRTAMKIICHSWFNVLLLAVPVGIAVANVHGMPPGAVFAINAVAIIPLAGLLSHATESVARKLGDAIGALLNVTFGNAVELIIFIIALAKNEIRIVQASLLGSILANLLLILGMAFFFGGLRFREQIYNSTVTQMSACLLSLSVCSLVLPTAFHASFANNDKADAESLKISRGTSVILLLVYVIYLLFQLKSHAYMYESTPQHIIDEESTPGPAAAWLESSSSESSDSSDSDSAGSSHSGNTMSKRVKRAIRSRRRRKSSVASVDTADEQTRSSSFGTNPASPLADNGSKSGDSSNGPTKPVFPRMNTEGSEEAIEEEPPKRHRKHRHKKYKHRKHRKDATPVLEEGNIPATSASSVGDLVALPVDGTGVSDSEPRRVDFADTVTNMDGLAQPGTPGAPARRPFTNLRAISFKPVKSLAPPVFSQAPAQGPNAPNGRVPRVRYGIRRTNSLPDRLNEVQYRAPGAMLPASIPHAALVEGDGQETGEHEDDLSRISAIVLLLVSTALVAVCAEFMVDSINAVVETSTIGETFIGLIILPIVGNAAEHVTALTVAMKNKMDLAIGVAVGSSIQIAIFITPLVVILGWIMNREMTLYFTLFETVCLFVSAFIVNFLVLDGRSNYLEGALLCAVYIIIAVVAFFYPEGNDAGVWGQ
ncbi:Sodium/calcium exchanger protein-domain-containing protein [Apiospora arundinis]|uniref:Sodium/calcium exchanger protein-domain-containing protein n=1 Tax=Apiospora arundinis TaxID=335852 RepID=A0ABR2I1M4_9PEZI